jgi:hypothetical protein
VALGQGYRSWVSGILRRDTSRAAVLMPSVNLGGWLVTEPFIVPALYEAYQNTTPQAVDEYTLCQA